MRNSVPGFRSISHLALGTFVLLALCSCTPGLKDPVTVDSPAGILDLSGWNFSVSGPVQPMGWLWDPDTLWSPGTGGRPDNLPPPLAMGPPDKGGSFVRALMQPRAPGSAGQPVVATAHLRVLVAPTASYALQIGAVPGAIRVWVNGVVVWESGVPSADPRRFQARGVGTVLQVQPRDGVVDIVAELASTDPLIRHSELNRLWILGPSGPMLASDRVERTWRALQAAVLLLGIVAFGGLARLRPDRKPLWSFVAFLAVCLVKLVVNVEHPEPLLGAFLPDVPASLYLLMNHGLNLVPFVLLTLFLHRQFPEEVGGRIFVWAAWVTLVVSLWELLPFVLLSWGWEDAYAGVMGAQWSFVLNLYVVLATVFIFERLYHLFHHGRPLGTALFFGGLGVGLMVLIPVPLSYFIPVRYTYFLGWGMFFFLFLIGFELIRLQVEETKKEAAELGHSLALRENLGRFSSALWANRLGRTSLELVRPGDRRPSEALLVAVSCSLSSERWLKAAGSAAQARDAVLVQWSRGTAVWALDGWSETALAMALEIRRSVVIPEGARLTVVVLKAVVEYRVVDLGGQWLPEAAGLPDTKLDELGALAQAWGATIVLDAAIQDGLVIGGWRRHRHLSVDGQVLELYEGEDETLAALKDRTCDAYEEALTAARAGQTEEAVKKMLPVVQQNPFDRAAREHLAAWGRYRRP